MSAIPTVSIIIPSYNQGQFIEETLCSVIKQSYHNIELIVIDGGSTDNTINILEKYDKYISYWISEPDRGQSHAINKGLKKCTGEWIAWINSDDCYLPGAFEYIFGKTNFNDYDFIYGQCFAGNKLETAVECRHPWQAKKNLEDILKFTFHVSHIIPSQSVFIRKSIIDVVGGLNESLHYCMDFDWYCRIYLYTKRRLFYSKTICFYRIDSHTKSVNGYQNVMDEAFSIAKMYKNKLPFFKHLYITIFLQYSQRLTTYISQRKCTLSTILKFGLMYMMFSMFDAKYKTLFMKTFNGYFGKNANQ